MTLGLTHLGRGHIPYSAPHFLTRVVPYGTLDGGLKRSLKIQRLVCNFEYSNLVIQCMTIQPCWLDFFFSLTFRRDIVDIPHTSSFAFMEQIKLVLHEIPHLSQVNCDGKENSQ